MISQSEQTARLLVEQIEQMDRDRDRMLKALDHLDPEMASRLDMKELFQQEEAPKPAKKPKQSDKAAKKGRRKAPIQDLRGKVIGLLLQTELDTAPQLAGALETSKTSVSRMLKTLQDEGKLISSKRSDDNALHYSVKDPEKVTLRTTTTSPTTKDETEQIRKGELAVAAVTEGDPDEDLREIH